MTCAAKHLCAWAALALALPASVWAGDVLPPQARPVTAASSPAATSAPTPASATTSPSGPEDPEARRARVKALLDDPDLQQKSAGPEDHEIGFGTYLQAFVALGIVVLLVYLTLNFGLRRLMGMRGAAGAQVVTVLQRIPLDQKKSMFVLKAAGEYLLVGGADGALSLICKLDREEVERLGQERSSPVPLSPFLQKLLTRRGGPPPAAS